MELVICHEWIGETCLVSNNPLWHTIVLFSPLTKSSHSLRRFQTRKGRSPQGIRRTINETKSRSPNDDARNPAILARGGVGGAEVLQTRHL